MHISIAMKLSKFTNYCTAIQCWESCFKVQCSVRYCTVFSVLLHGCVTIHWFNVQKVTGYHCMNMHRNSVLKMFHELLIVASHFNVQWVAALLHHNQDFSQHSAFLVILWIIALISLLRANKITRFYKFLAKSSDHNSVFSEVLNMLNHCMTILCSVSWLHHCIKVLRAACIQHNSVLQCNADNSSVTIPGIQLPNNNNTLISLEYSMPWNFYQVDATLIIRWQVNTGWKQWLGAVRQQANTFIQCKPSPMISYAFTGGQRVMSSFQKSRLYSENNIPEHVSMRIST